MKIVLLRHGKPDMPDLGKMTGSEFINWINLYNDACLESSSSPVADSVEISKNCHSAVCSTLARSVESAEKLGLSENVEISPDFTEVGLPSFNVLNLKFSKDIWLFIFRVFWLIGYSPNSESYLQAKYRAKKCSVKLIETAKENGSVVFVGLGILNKLLSGELRNRGWQGAAKPKNRYWQFSIYEKET